MPLEKSAAEHERPVAVECQHIERWDVMGDLVATGAFGSASASLKQCPWWADESAKRPPTSPSN